MKLKHGGRLKIDLRSLGSCVDLLMVDVDVETCIILLPNDKVRL